jgi:outer membrane immunogenic protein
MRINTAIAAFLMLGATGAASAADLPRKAPSYVAPSYYDWTGFYIGANAGYGWTTTFAGNPRGFVGGGQLGYNWQTGNFVVGIEGDIQYSALKSEVDLGGGVTGAAKIPAFATVRGRLGYAFDRALVYGTGGWAYTKTEASLSGAGVTISDSKWTSGYALGAGLEYALWNRWTVKGEYLYVRSGDVSLTLAGLTASGNYTVNVARVGLNYRF